MNAAPRVSIVVPVYNGQRTIDDCVRSLLDLSASDPEFELIIVDNASTDGTAGLLARYGERARILYEARRGPSAARNRGLMNARGEIVAFTDADCVVHRDWLREIVRPLEDPAVGIVGGTILAREPCNDIERFGERIHDHRLAIEYYQPPYAITMNWASRRAVLESVGPFDPDLLRGEDGDLAYRIVQAGYRITFAPGAVVYHSNERTLLGLAREGYAHGYHSVPVLRKHARFLESYPPASRPPQARAGRPLYWSVFNLGKSLGKAVATRRAGRSA